MATLHPTPLLLTAAMNIASASEAIADSARLTPPFRRPALLREIRFRVIFTGTNAAAPNQCIGQNGDSVECSLKLGRLEVTHGFVPVWLLGPAACPDGEVPGALLSAGSNISAAGNPELLYGGYTNRVNTYRWILPKPMFIPPGTNLQCRIRIGRATAARTFTVHVTYAGLLLPPTTKTPAALDVAYAAAFNPVGTAVLSDANQVLLSDATMLVNATERALNTQRLTGRILLQSVGGATVIDGNYDYMGLESNARPCMIEVTNSNGDVIVNETPFNVAFSAYREMRMQGVLDKNDYVRAKIRVGGFLAGLNACTALQVGMTGWRAEPAEAM